jgi:hypothetical protein
MIGIACFLSVTEPFVQISDVPYSAIPELLPSRLVVVSLRVEAWIEPFTIKRRIFFCIPLRASQFVRFPGSR